MTSHRNLPRPQRPTAVRPTVVHPVVFPAVSGVLTWTLVWFLIWPLTVVPAPSTWAAPAVHTGTFDVRHEFDVSLPEDVETLRMWVILPQDVPQQSVEGLKVESPYSTRETQDNEGNRMLFLEVENPETREFTLATVFKVVRQEDTTALAGVSAPFVSGEEKESLSKYLGSSSHVILDERIRKLARDIVGGEKNSIAAARKIYDWVLDNIDYWVKDPANKKASGIGSTEYCLTTRTGNCTDFHSLYTSLARAAGIPTRMIYGSLFKTELNGLDIDQSYHCWLEFYAPGNGWVPVDVAVADIFVGDFRLTDENATLVRRTTADGYEKKNQEKVDYYFGNLDERRVTWSLGRDLLLEPRQSGDPVNALPKAYVEVDGKPLPEGEGWKRKLTYREL